MKRSKNRNRLLSLLLAALCAGVLGGCVPANDPVSDRDAIELIQLEPPRKGQDIAILHTSGGDIKMMLFTEQAPNTCAHFKRLVESGFYNGIKIAEIDRSACTLHTGVDEESDTGGRVMTDNGKDVPIELSPNLLHFSGAVSAYQELSGFNSKYTDSDSRFFIVGSKEPDETTYAQMKAQNYPDKICDAYLKHGGLLEVSGCYTIFGQVYEGLEIVNDLIQNTELQQGTTFPAEDIIITSIELSTYTADADAE